MGGSNGSRGVAASATAVQPSTAATVPSVATATARSVRDEDGRACRKPPACQRARARRTPPACRAPRGEAAMVAASASVPEAPASEGPDRDDLLKAATATAMVAAPTADSARPRPLPAPKAAKEGTRRSAAVAAVAAAVAGRAGASTAPPKQVTKSRPGDSAEANFRRESRRPPSSRGPSSPRTLPAGHGRTGRERRRYRHSHGANRSGGCADRRTYRSSAAPRRTSHTGRPGRTSGAACPGAGRRSAGSRR